MNQIWPIGTEIWCRTDGRNGRTDGRTDDAKTISLRLRRRLKKSGLRLWYLCIQITLLQESVQWVYRYWGMEIQIHIILLLSCQPRVRVTSFFVYKVIRDLESIDHFCINPITLYQTPSVSVLYRHDGHVLNSYYWHVIVHMRAITSRWMRLLKTLTRAVTCACEGSYECRREPLWLHVSVDSRAESVFLVKK